MPLGCGGGGGTRGGRHVGVLVRVVALRSSALGRAAATGRAGRGWPITRGARLVAPAYRRGASILRLLQRAAARRLVLAARSLAALGLAALGT
eukprot:scaffold96484_cov45-Phaeocystis_antarctica.AAC.1